METNNQEALPGLELSTIVEGMSLEARLEHKRRYLSEISDREMLCRLIDEVNEVEYGEIPNL